jgi:hypothetical protein
MTPSHVAVPALGKPVAVVPLSCNRYPMTFRLLRGRQVAASTGGSKSRRSSGVACGAQMAVNDGSELLIFVRPRTHDPSLIFLDSIFWVR